jgi:hypothetical protein
MEGTFDLLYALDRWGTSIIYIRGELGIFRYGGANGLSITSDEQRNSVIYAIVRSTEVG